MTRAQKTILAFLGMTACGLIGLIGWIAYQTYWTKPLGPALNLPTLPASSATSGLVAISPTLPTAPTGYAYLPTVTPPPTFTPIAVFTPSVASCGVSSPMTILAIGTDARSNSYLYGLADVIRVVRVDFMQAKVSILEFPRDLWVEIPEIADNIHGQDHEKLNQAYLYGNPGFGYWDDPSAGPGLLARTLNLNFGVHPDHYIAVNMRTFEQIVDAVDGIDVYLPIAVDGRSKGDMRKSLYFDKRIHHLDGAEALQLARIRIDGVFERADTQNRVLCALRDKLVSPNVLPKIPAIITSFTDNVQTDLSPEQIGQLVCLGTKLDPSAILFASFPEELFKGTRIYDPVFKARVFIWDVDFSVLRDYVTKFNEGVWPVPDSGADTKKSTPFCPPPGQ
jgi:LCP family protein required for cell wall assembly